MAETDTESGALDSSTDTSDHYSDYQQLVASDSFDTDHSFDDEIHLTQCFNKGSDGETRGVDIGEDDRHSGDDRADVEDEKKSKETQSSKSIRRLSVTEEMKHLPFKSLLPRIQSADCRRKDKAPTKKINTSAPSEDSTKVGTPVAREYSDPILSREAHTLSRIQEYGDSLQLSRVSGNYSKTLEHVTDSTGIYRHGSAAREQLHNINNSSVTGEKGIEDSEESKAANSNTRTLSRRNPLFVTRGTRERIQETLLPRRHRLGEGSLSRDVLSKRMTKEKRSANTGVERCSQAAIDSQLKSCLPAIPAIHNINQSTKRSSQEDTTRHSRKSTKASQKTSCYSKDLSGCGGGFSSGGTLDCEKAARCNNQASTHPDRRTPEITQDIRAFSNRQQRPISSESSSQRTLYSEYRTDGKERVPDNPPKSVQLQRISHSGSTRARIEAKVTFTLPTNNNALSPEPNSESSDKQHESKQDQLLLSVPRESQPTYVTRAASCHLEASNENQNARVTEGDTKRGKGPLKKKSHESSGSTHLEQDNPKVKKKKSSARLPEVLRRRSTPEHVDPQENASDTKPVKRGAKKESGSVSPISTRRNSVPDQDRVKEKSGVPHAEQMESSPRHRQVPKRQTGDESSDDYTFITPPTPATKQHRKKKGDGKHLDSNISTQQHPDEHDPEEFREKRSLSSVVSQQTSSDNDELATRTKSDTPLPEKKKIISETSSPHSVEELSHEEGFDKERSTDKARVKKISSAILFLERSLNELSPMDHSGSMPSTSAENPSKKTKSYVASGQPDPRVLLLTDSVEQDGLTHKNSNPEPRKRKKHNITAIASHKTSNTDLPGRSQQRSKRKKSPINRSHKADDKNTENLKETQGDESDESASHDSALDLPTKSTLEDNPGEECGSIIPSELPSPSEKESEESMISEPDVLIRKLTYEVPMLRVDDESSENNQKLSIPGETAERKSSFERKIIKFSNSYSGATTTSRTLNQPRNANPTELWDDSEDTKEWDKVHQRIKTHVQSKRQNASSDVTLGARGRGTENPFSDTTLDGFRKTAKLWSKRSSTDKEEPAANQSSSQQEKSSFHVDILTLVQQLIKKKDQTKSRLRWLKAMKLVCNLLYIGGTLAQRSYRVSSKYPNFIDIGDDALIVEKTKERNFIDKSMFKISSKHGFSMLHDEEMTLTIEPEERTEQQIGMLLYSLQVVQAFSQFPMRIQRAIARNAFFTRVKKKRVIVRQGQEALNYYFILCGQAVATEVIETENGSFCQTHAIMREGQGFGELAITHKTSRTVTVTSRSDMQLLVLSKNDYIRIFLPERFTDGIPDYIKYLAECSWMKGFPVEKLLNNPTKCFVRYFRHRSLIVADSTDEDYLYVVRHGRCQVLMLIDSEKACWQDLEILWKKELNKSNEYLDLYDIHDKTRIKRTPVRKPLSASDIRSESFVPSFAAWRNPSRVRQGTEQKTTRDGGQEQDQVPAVRNRAIKSAPSSRKITKKSFDQQQGLTEGFRSFSDDSLSTHLASARSKLFRDSRKENQAPTAPFHKKTKNIRPTSDAIPTVVVSNVVTSSTELNEDSPQSTSPPSTSVSFRFRKRTAGALLPDFIDTDPPSLVSPNASFAFDSFDSIAEVDLDMTVERLINSMGSISDDLDMVTEERRYSKIPVVLVKKDGHISRDSDNNSNSGTYHIKTKGNNNKDNNSNSQDIKSKYSYMNCIDSYSNDSNSKGNNSNSKDGAGPNASANGHVDSASMNNTGDQAGDSTFRKGQAARDSKNNTGRGGIKKTNSKRNAGRSTSAKWRAGSSFKSKRDAGRSTSAKWRAGSSFKSKVGDGGNEITNSKGDASKTTSMKGKVGRNANKRDSSTDRKEYACSINNSNKWKAGSVCIRNNGNSSESSGDSRKGNEGTDSEGSADKNSNNTGDAGDSGKNEDSGDSSDSSDSSSYWNPTHNRIYNRNNNNLLKIKENDNKNNNVGTNSRSTSPKIRPAAGENTVNDVWQKKRTPSVIRIHKPNSNEGFVGGENSHDDIRRIQLPKHSDWSSENSQNPSPIVASSGSSGKRSFCVRRRPRRRYRPPEKKEEMSSWDKRRLYRVPSRCQPRRRESSAPEKEDLPKVYAEMEILEPGDVFGFDQLTLPCCIQKKTHKVSLVSEGAEVIMIQKRFFVQNANVRVQHAVQGLTRAYPSPKKVQSTRRMHLAWEKYKEKIKEDYNMSGVVVFQRGPEVDPLASIGLIPDVR